MTTTVLFSVPPRNRDRLSSLKGFLKSNNPFSYLNQATGLRAVTNIKIYHKNLGHAAEFKIPNTIYVDFRQPVHYLALSIAHEYAHLILQKNHWEHKNKIADYIASIDRPKIYNYTSKSALEQLLAILLQLSYEDRMGTRRFTKKNAKELMTIMAVWPLGKYLLNHWPEWLKEEEGGTGLLRWLGKTLARE